jgi:dTDP-4-amino-4,6-dideoxygalactose transaminase
MTIPLTDLKAQYLSIKNEIDQAVSSVLMNTQFIIGPEVKALEKEVAAYCGTGYGVGVASGTDALELALIACGIKTEDEVITTPFTFGATTETITRCGAKPVFADIDPKTYNINVNQIESKITKKTKALLPVQLFGQASDMDSILAIAKKHNLKVIEDCAQSFGAKYRNKMTGSFGDAGCFSFFPSKVLGCYGDGGMVLTSNTEISEKVTMLRNHGTKQKYYHEMNGFNSRLDELQAAILRVKLRHINDWIKLRQQKSMLYNQLFSKIEGVEYPYIAPGNDHVFNYFNIRVNRPNIDRDAVIKYLNSKGISTAVYYPLSLHLQPVYKEFGYKTGDFPESEKAQAEIISLPIYAELKDEDISYIVNAVKESMG